jgi:hypoxanthine phosphoribosyltransferase
MSNIHKSDYFSIARDIKKTKYRPYIKNYYKFKDEKDKELFKRLENSNVLIVDDIATSGTTISHLLKTIRSLNDKNNITVFSLLGKNIEI